MTCFVCRADAVGICTHCGAALCAAHFREARAYSVGGMRFGCPHVSVSGQATERPRTSIPLARSMRAG